MTVPETGAVSEWYARDVRALEVQAVSAYLGAETADLEALLPPLLALGCARSQLQPMLERAWTRLQGLRERLAELRGMNTDAAVSAALARAADALRAPGDAALVAATTAIEDAVEACHAAGGPAQLAAGLCGVEAVATALGGDFLRAAALSEDAADLAGDAGEAWRYRVQQAEFLLDRGREFNDTEALEELRSLCEHSLLPVLGDSRPDARRAWVYDCLGQTLGISGRQQSGTHTLREAITAFEQALSCRDRDTAPYEWAATQNHLGNALGTLGQRTRDLELLDRSVAAFEAALQVPASNVAPEARASAQSNLAAVLQTIGVLREDVDVLRRAVDAYRAALAVWTPQRKPFFWAATLGNVGAALRRLGEFGKGASALQQAVDACQAALSVRTRERMPREWALSQNDLGAAQQALAEENEDQLGLGRAISAYREALKELTRDGAPMTWAQTMANLGVARPKLAEQNRDLTIARRAAADINQALDVFRAASHAYYTDLALEQLSFANRLISTLQETADG